jgi:tryptophan synthase alpha chain
MNRIDQRFQQLRSSGTKAFVAYVVAGDPDLATTLDIILALEQAGADIIELGIPFSDPLADGVVNQLASQRALENGTTLAGIFGLIEKTRRHTQIPLVLFTYFNPVFSYGVDNFLKTAASAGADGTLILDLPPEEAATEWISASPLRRISLIAPTTPLERMQRIVKTSSGFIYYVSREGVTGMQSGLPPNIAQPLHLIRQNTSLPICVGFGISTPEQAHFVANLADGVVVGSALVNVIAHNSKQANLPHIVQTFAQPLAQAVHHP